MTLPPLILCRDGSTTEDPRECEPRETLEGDKRLRLSKRVSGILRHFPHKYGLQLDPHGWVDIRLLVKALKNDPQFHWVKEWHIRALALHDPKGRFEIRGHRIRARYGHSLPVSIEPLPTGEAPPSVLFHATPARNLPSIMKEGLKPGKRTHVHLTDDPNTAIETGKRHGGDVVLLEVNVDCMKRHGIPVERRAPHIYVAPRVPPACIRRLRTLL